MSKLSHVGRIFYGVAIAVLGLLTIYYGDFPYMLIPPKHQWIPGLAILANASGALLVFAGASIVLNRRTRPVSLVLGSVLLLVFIFYFVPYQLFFASSFTQLVAWENAEKELTLAAGAFVIAGCYVAKNEIPLIRMLSKAIPFGNVLFVIPIISFGIIHFQYAKDVADYVPSWVPFRLFWAYFAGAALIGSGISILFNIKRRLSATLLGLMILTWFIILHVPRVIVSTIPYLNSEITSAFIALAYSGVAFVIAAGGRDSAASN